MTGYEVVCNDVSYANGRHKALDRVSGTIRRNVFTGLVGRNGAGKSTLLNLLGYRRRPYPGSVLVDG